jgi:hypothetical protein
MTDKKVAPLDFGQSSGAIENYPLKNNNFVPILQADFQDNLEVLKANKEIPQQITPEPFSSSDNINSEFLRLMRISLKTVQSWRDAKLVNYSQIGNKIYYRISDIQELLERNSNKSKNK